jgi:hypothetical protein
VEQPTAGSAAEPMSVGFEADEPAGPDAPTLGWRYVQPVAPVLPRSPGSRRRRSVAIGAAALVVVVAVIGAVAVSLPSSTRPGPIAGAAGTPAPTAAPQAAGQEACQTYLASLASRLGISVATLEQALDGAASDTIDQLVAQGRLNADQATKLKAAMASHSAAPCTSAGRIGPRPGGLFGLPLPFAQGWGRQPRAVGPDLTAVLDAAASALKITPAALQEELEALTRGQDLRTIAARHNVDYATLTAAIHAAVKTQLDAAVTKGTISASQETALLARVDQALAAGNLPLGEFGRGVGRGWKGANPARPAPTPTATPTGA